MMNEIHLVNKINADKLDLNNKEGHMTFCHKGKAVVSLNPQALHHHSQCDNTTRSGGDLGESGDSSSSLDTIVEKATEGSYVLDSEENIGVISPYLDIQLGDLHLGATGSAQTLDKLKKTQSFKVKNIKRTESMKKGLRRQAPIVLRKSVDRGQCSAAKQVNQDTIDHQREERDDTCMLTLAVPETNPRVMDKDDGYDSPSTYSSDVTSSTNTSVMVSPGTQHVEMMTYSSPPRPDTLPGLDTTHIVTLPVPDSSFIKDTDKDDGYGSNQRLVENKEIGVNNTMVNLVTAELIPKDGSSKLSCEGKMGVYSEISVSLPSYPGYSGQQSWLNDKQGQIPPPVQTYEHYNMDNGFPGHASATERESNPSKGRHYHYQGYNTTGHNLTNVSPSYYPTAPRHDAVKTDYGYVETNKISGFKAMNAQLRRSTRYTRNEKVKLDSAVLHNNQGNQKVRSVEEKLRDLVLWSDNTTKEDIENGNQTMQQTTTSDSSIEDMVKSWESRSINNSQMNGGRATHIAGTGEQSSSISNNNPFLESLIANNNNRINQYGSVEYSNGTNELGAQSSHDMESENDTHKNSSTQVNNSRGAEVNYYSGKDNVPSHYISANAHYDNCDIDARNENVQVVQNGLSSNSYSASDSSQNIMNNNNMHIIRGNNHHLNMTHIQNDLASNKGANTPVTSLSTKECTLTERGSIDPIPRAQSHPTDVSRSGLPDRGNLTAKQSIHYSGNDVSDEFTCGYKTVDNKSNSPTDNAVRQVDKNLSNCYKEVENSANRGSGNACVLNSESGVYTVYPPLKGLGPHASHRDNTRGNNAVIHGRSSKTKITRADVIHPSVNGTDNGSEAFNSKKVRFQLDLHGNMQHTTHYINKDTHSPIDCPHHLYNSQIFNTKPANPPQRLASFTGKTIQNDLNKPSTSDPPHVNVYSNLVNIESNHNEPKPPIKIRTLADIKPVPAQLVISQNIPTTSSQSMYLDLVHSFTTSTAVAATRPAARSEPLVQQHTERTGQNFSENGIHSSQVKQMCGHFSGETYSGSNSDNNFESNPHISSSHQDSVKKESLDISTNNFYKVNLNSQAVRYGQNSISQNLYHNGVQTGHDQQLGRKNDERKYHLSNYKRTENEHQTKVNNWVQQSSSAQQLKKMMDSPNPNGPLNHDIHSSKSGRLTYGGAVSAMYQENKNEERKPALHHSQNAYTNSTSKTDMVGHDESDYQKRSQVIYAGEQVGMDLPKRQPPSYEEYMSKKHNHQAHMDLDAKHKALDLESSEFQQNRLRSSMSDPNIAEWLQQSSNTFRYNNLLSKSSTMLHNSVDGPHSTVNDMQVVTLEQRRMASFRSQKGPMYATTCEIYQMLASRRGNPLAMKSPYYKHFAESSL